MTRKRLRILVQAKRFSAEPEGPPARREIVLPEPTALIENHEVVLQLFPEKPMLPGLETPRLNLRPLELADARQIQNIFPHWEIVRFLAKRVPWPYPPGGALTYCRDIALPAMARGEEWHWTLRLKTHPLQIIGCISLMQAENHNRGFWIGLPWQGKGLMSEAVETVTEYWFNELGFPALRAPKAILNIASRKISERTGMRVIAVEEREYVSGRLPSEIWEVTAEEWRTRGKR